MTARNELLLFYAARAAGLLVKPLTLWILVKLQATDASYFVATYYFLVAATFIALNAEAHIPFFKLRFGGEEISRHKLGIEFRNYTRALFSHIAVFLPLIMLGFFYYLGNVIEAAMFSLFILLEKFWDELQRYMIFSRRYTQWSLWFIAKMLTPSLAIAIAYWLKLDMMWSVCFAMSAFAVALTMTMLRQKERRMLLHSATNALRSSTSQYFTAYKQRFAIAQLLAISSTNLLQMDKWLTGQAGLKSILVELVLLSQFGAVFIVLIDNLFFSRNRDRFVLKKCHISEIVAWPRMFMVAFVYLSGALLVISIFKATLGIAKLELLDAGMAISIFVIVGMTRPLTEHAFWHLPRHRSAMVDVATIATMAILGYWTLSSYGLHGMFVMLVLALSLRAAGFLALCQRSCIDERDFVK